MNVHKVRHPVDNGHNDHEALDPALHTIEWHV